jgi:hypothetical protein
MSNFAYVKDSAIVHVWDTLPANWENISNFYVLGDGNNTDYLKSLGWYPITYQAPTYDPATQVVGHPTYTISGDTVIESHAVSDKPIPEPTPELTEEQIASARAHQWSIVRRQRDNFMSLMDWKYNRYAREVRLNLTPTEDITVLDTYMEALANITEQSDPYNITWPNL